MGIQPRDEEMYYGLCALDTFKRNFNLFTTGYPDKNILDGIDWGIFAVSGSVMPACTQEIPVLMNVHNNVSYVNDKNILDYFDWFYGDSDIDVMCGVNTLSEFLKHSHNLINKIQENIPNYVEGDINIEVDKTTCAIIT